MPPAKAAGGRRGATRPRRRGLGARIRNGCKAWLLNHLHAAVFSLGQLARNSLGSLMTAAVVGIALALPAGFYLILDNAQRVTHGWDATLQIALFLDSGVSPERAEQLAGDLRREPDIRDVHYISRRAALEEFRELSGLAEAIDALPENPLPAVLLIEPAGGSTADAATYERLLHRLGALPEVDRAQFDRQWLMRLQAIVQAIERAVLILACVLALAVLLIIGNTIRLAIFNRRPEIEITKLFGATDAFIQRPFLYTGFWYGLIGAALAWLLVTAAFLFLRTPVAELAALYASDYRLSGASPAQVAVLFLTGISLGLAGSWLAVQRHLKAIEPA